ncbi:MAG: PIN domain-containing protein [Candidatus Methanoperedens sp.]|nr:PIN domain-containing protein [Candidatus Methanoperedens sp.]
MIAQEPNFNETLHWLDSSNNDDRIIASVLEIQRANPSATVVLVTSDINHQNKAEMANLPFLEPPEGDKAS